MRHGQRRLSCTLSSHGLWLALVLAALGPGRGQAQTGNSDDGGRLAAVWCSECHQTGAGTQATANDAIPSFQAIAAMPSTTSMSIRAFLSTSHKVMPDFKLADGEIDDLGAYILSLRVRGR